jgi:hypothetical protein
MIEEEEMEKQVNDGTFDSMILNVQSILHIMQFKKQQNTRKKELDN